ncbi:hypothetical protein CVV68_10365 [Arthrobacter livingstonensis]|uniref:Tetratricopeptide repeat protein n=1 Tax=Arthrobacter livingstonensis TaxID=670078 RepID=A0A2V5L7L8_9MICC|nr:hypothetical protein [Arthrobacter livingstonensis]PYI67485.1 hypothetical protein CVV68_10365 [Arthrobacter livingstonensis]
MSIPTTSAPIAVPVAANGPAAVTSCAEALRHRRRKLLLFSTPVLLLALLLACKLLSLPIFAGQAAHSFGLGNGDGTLRAARVMGAANVVERWKAPFAAGDGHVLRGEYPAARDEFAAALALAPEAAACKVRVNLVLTLEQLGDAAAKAGDPASAANHFRAGASEVAQAPRGCFIPHEGGNKDGEGDRLRQAGERLAEKQRSRAQAGDQAQSGKAEDPSGVPAPPQNKIDQLDNRGQGAQRQRAKGLQQRGDQDPPAEYGKPW